MSIIDDMLLEISKTEYGEVNFSVITHQGKPVALESQRFRKIKYHTSDNAKATAEVVQLIKNMVDRKQSGVLNFTITFSEGNIKELVNYFHNKKNYKNENAIDK